MASPDKPKGLESDETRERKSLAVGRFRLRVERVPGRALIRLKLTQLTGVRAGIQPVAREPDQAADERQAGDADERQGELEHATPPSTTEAARRG